MRWWVRDKLLITGLIALVAASAWWAWSTSALPPDRRADVSTYGQFVLALVGTVIMLSELVRRLLARAPLRSPEILASLLATAVQGQWTRAAGERLLLEPACIPVRWQRSRQRIAGPVSGAVSGSDVPARFPPLSGLQSVTRAELEVGGLPELFAVYGGLASGRLVITGEPGSGKSGTAILLLLEALRHHRPGAPVPVLFTLQGWDPYTQSLEAWLAGRLAETYPLFAGRNAKDETAALLDTGKLAVFLDGLDEVAEDLRPVVLQALSEQARCRVVLLTRRDEMVAAAVKAHFVGAVALEVQDVDNVTAADYLTRTQLDPPPAGWRELIDFLRRYPASPIAQALRTPLMLTLVRDTYRSDDDVLELLHSFYSRHGIEGHLLDRVLPAAYAHHLGASQSQSPFRRFDCEVEQATRWLRFIANDLTDRKTADLSWWELSAAAPRWLPSFSVGLAAGLGGAFGFPFPVDFGLGLLSAVSAGLAVDKWTQASREQRSLIKGAAGGLLGGLTAGLTALALFGSGVGSSSAAAFLAGGLAFALAVVPFGRVVVGFSGAFLGELTAALSRQAPIFHEVGLTLGLGAHLLNGLGIGVVAGVAVGLARRDTPAEGLRWSLKGFVCGAVAGIVTGLVVWIQVGFIRGLIVGCVATIAGAVAGGLIIEAPSIDKATAATPRGVLVRDRATFCSSILGLGTAVGIITGLSFGASPSTPGGPPNGLGVGLGVGLANFLAVGLVFAFLQAAWGTFTLARWWLAATRRLPWRLMAFLTDAHESRHVLRTVGPRYQFRHERLQQRLAAHVSDTRLVRTRQTTDNSSLINSGPASSTRSDRRGHPSIVALATSVGLICFLVAEALPGNLPGVMAFLMGFAVVLALATAVLVGAIFARSRQRP